MCPARCGRWWIFWWKRFGSPAGFDILKTLSRRPEESGWLENRLVTHDLCTYTSYTIATKERLRIELARVRVQGWALSEQQMELNYRGIAVPLRDRHGQLVGALSVTMPIGHESTEEAVARVLSVLSETAQAMRITFRLVCSRL